MDSKKSVGRLVLTLITILSCSGLMAMEMPKWSGDLRYRHERKSSGTGAAKSDVVRERIRARLQMDGKVSDKLSATVRIATGNQSATSTNETLGDNGANDALDLDLAYAKYMITDSTSFTFGKMKMPFYRVGGVDTIFDGDWTPEGMSLAYQREMGSIKVKASFSRIWMAQASNSSNEFLMAPQLYVRWKGPVKVKLGASYFNFTSADASATEYKITELFAKVGKKFGQFKTAVFAQTATNSEITGANPNDKSYYLGAQVKCKKTKLKLKYDYRRSEVNSSPDSINDGDACGGSTGCYGHRVKLSGKVGQLGLGLTFLDHTKTSDLTHYNVLQADLKIKF